MIVYGFGLRVSGSGFRFGLVLACLAHDFLARTNMHG